MAREYKLDNNWMRRAFGLDFVGPRLPLPDYPVDKKVSLRKVMESVPLSPLGATLQSLTLTRGQWIDLVSGPLLADTVAKWHKLSEGIESIVYYPEAFAAWRDLTNIYKTFDEFKKSIHFRFLTSDLSDKEFFEEYYASDRDRVDLLFSGLEDSSINRKLKKAVLGFLHGDIGRQYSACYVLIIIGVLLSVIGKVTDIDAFIGIVCKTLPQATVGSAGYSVMCNWQKGIKDEGGLAAIPGVWFIKRDNVHLRSGPGKNFESIVKLREQDTFLLQQDPGKGWMKIQTEVHGVRYEGWVSRRFVAFLKSPPK